MYGAGKGIILNASYAPVAHDGPISQYLKGLFSNRDKYYMDINLANFKLTSRQDYF